MNKFIILDRDGIINKLISDEAIQKMVGPHSVNKIDIYPWVSDCLEKINNLGFGIVIATNQPDARKGLTTKETLKAVHYTIVERIETNTARILKSYICFHINEDNCSCRKPKPGLLDSAYQDFKFDKEYSWMVGDRHVDVLAGKACGVKTALLTPNLDKELKEVRIGAPNFVGHDLRDFVEFLENC